MSENTAISVQGNASPVCVFNDPELGQQFVSFVPDTREAKVILYNAINTPDERLSSHINKEIALVDVIVCYVRLNDRNDDTDDDKEKNPFVEAAPRSGYRIEAAPRYGYRTIIIDENGISYTATSSGIYNSIQTLRTVFGTLHFDEPLKVVVRQIAVKNGNTLSLQIAK